MAKWMSSESNKEVVPHRCLQVAGGVKGWDKADCSRDRDDFDIVLYDYTITSQI